MNMILKILKKLGLIKTTVPQSTNLLTISPSMKENIKDVSKNQMLTIEDLRQPNFKPEEFLRSETARRLGIDNNPNQEHLKNGVKLGKKMQELRDVIKKPFSITSGYRCELLNQAVGGSPNSWHMKFLACDFNIQGFEPHEAVLEIKKTGVSVDKVFVEKGCVHMQTCYDDKDNRNFFGTAYKEDGVWKVTNKIEKI